jgi:peptidyl-prolyl cis-trans isomerase B (cyclophilin B)
MNKEAITGLLFLIMVIGVIFFTTQKFLPSSSNNPLSVLSQTPTGFGVAQQDQSLKAQQEAYNKQVAAQAAAEKAAREQAAKELAVPNPTADIPLKASQAATLQTSKGDIKLVLYTDKAPNTVKNFVSKAKSGYYKNLTFHRVEDWVVQGGDPKGDGSGGGSMPVEFNEQPFVIGSLGVASRGDGQVQNDSQFFITKKDASWLNGKYTNFGVVVKGMDVVNKMAIGDKIFGITLD